MSSYRRRPPPSHLPPRAGAGAPAAPLTPSLPAVPGLPAGPSLPDFSGAIRTFTGQWADQAQAGLGLLLLLAGAAILVLGTDSGRQAALAGVSLTPQGRALRLL